MTDPATEPDAVPAEPDTSNDTTARFDPAVDLVRSSPTPGIDTGFAAERAVALPVTPVVDAADGDGDGDVSVSERLAWARRVWRATPRSMRRVVVAVIGGTLILLGAALVVLPGPFTLPLLVAGFATLATEFAWAAHALERGRSATHRAKQAVLSLRRR